MLAKRLGRYELREEIGRGMMGVVYQAHDPQLERTLALKTIELGFVLSPTERQAFEERFLVEAKLVARLSHPGIVIVHDVGRDPETGTLYMALEHLDGRTLAQIIKQGPPYEWHEALRVTRQIADALTHAHAHGVIHRDIKPGNIMLHPTGEPKIMDFGIAKAETSRIHLTAAGQSMGTPLYMSPEQALGEPVDARTDLFSLGAIAYSLLTGRPAFWADSMMKIISRVVEEDPPPPSHWVADIPPEVDRIVLKALAKKPAERYVDARSMSDDIARALAGRAEGTPTPPAAVVPAPPQLDSLLDGATPYRSESDLPTVDLEAQLATLVPHATAESEPLAAAALIALSATPAHAPQAASQDRAPTGSTTGSTTAANDAQAAPGPARDSARSYRHASSRGFDRSLRGLCCLPALLAPDRRADTRDTARGAGFRLAACGRSANRRSPANGSSPSRATSQRSRPGRSAIGTTGRRFRTLTQGRGASDLD
jgi:serine/threonine protein kinase